MYLVFVEFMDLFCSTTEFSKKCKMTFEVLFFFSNQKRLVQKAQLYNGFIKMYLTYFDFCQ